MISFCVMTCSFWVIGWFRVVFLPFRALMKVVIHVSIMIPRMRKKAMKKRVS